MSNQIPTFKGSLVSNLVIKKEDSKKNDSQIWSTEKVKEAMAYLSKGKKPPIGNPFFEKKFGQRRSNLVFQYTKEELAELKKCKDDIFYFAQKYCMIKTDEGLYTHFNLRDYQINSLKTIQENKKVVYMASRQIGKCFLPNSLITIQIPDCKIQSSELKSQTMSFLDFFYTFIDTSFLGKIKRILWKIYLKLDY